MKKRNILLAFILVILLLLPVFYFSGYFEQVVNLNKKPVVTITYPYTDDTVFHLVMISGTASDANGDNTIEKVEVQIDDADWVLSEGTTTWSYEWNAYERKEGGCTIHVRAYDGKDYSDAASVSVVVKNPTSDNSGSHQWAVFIVAANFPEKNESKLGNGGLYLAEDMVKYLIEKCGYATSHITLLFDDGWIRSVNGYGAKEQTLQQRRHEYDITYGAATKTNVINVLAHLISQSNAYEDSEVFIWLFNHGAGDQDKPLTGGKLLQSSEIFLWDDTLTDKELGALLAPLESKKVTILVDACYAGGFANRLIFNLRTSLFFRSGIPGNGRVVISATSKFRPGYASTAQGPIFSLAWFEGISTGDADGFRPGLLDRGVPRNLKLFKDGKVSVEEAFYYARYQLRTDENLREFESMQPQINDQYPHKGILRSRDGLVLGED